MILLLEQKTKSLKMKRTASILLDVTAAQAKALAALQAAYADACNALVPIVREHRVWNRVAFFTVPSTSRLLR